MEKKKATIRNWNIRDFGHYKALEGMCKDHPVLGLSPIYGDGYRHILTSPIVKIDLENKIVETRNTIYILEGPEHGLSPQTRIS